MIPADDVVTRRILPTVRSLVAHALDERRLTERQIAERLGLTQSAVSKYLRDRVRVEPLVLEAETFRVLARDLEDGLAEDRLSSMEVLGRILEAVRKEEDRGLVCRLHEEEVPSLVGLGCDLCVRANRSELRAEQEILSDLRLALRSLLSLPGFERLIPSVGSNLARAKPEARTTDDVAAVPGRLFVMRGSVRAPAAPEFGASKHVAEMVLAVRRSRPDLTAAINIRWDESIVSAARALGWRMVEFNADLEGQGDRIARAIVRRQTDYRMVYQRGAFGIEPITYLLGKTAREVVDAVRALLGALAG
jgi:hypothetical protein